MNKASIVRTKYVRTTPRAATKPKTYEPGSFMFYATIAARNEAEGNLEEAQIMWLRAKPVANKEVNREWAGRRADVCKQRKNKWSAA